MGLLVVSVEPWVGPFKVEPPGYTWQSEKFLDLVSAVQYIDVPSVQSGNGDDADV